MSDPRFAGRVRQITVVIQEGKSAPVAQSIIDVPMEHMTVIDVDAALEALAPKTYESLMRQLKS